MLAMLIAVEPAGAVARTCPFQRSVSVYCGGMSSAQVRIVRPATITLLGVYAAQPDGVIVQPRHGSSNPQLKHHGSISAGTVSQMCTFHHVFWIERFLAKIE